MSKTTVDMDGIGGPDASPERKKQIAERMKSFLEKEYTLTFNREASIYKEEEVLEASTGGRGGFGGFASSLSGGPKYKNVKSKELLQDQEFFGKQFLIKDELADLKWTMSGESKQIGNYTVFKATTIKQLTGFDFSSFRPGRRGNDAEKKNEEKEETKEPKTVSVVAWYTMQIPVNQGPDDYWGLPGLILEVSAGNTTILCTKVVMNPKDKDKIDKPKKGEVVTQQEYTEITTKKMQELRESRGRDGRGGRGGRGGRRN
jgi:GLPGLI family protein